MEKYIFIIVQTVLAIIPKSWKKLKEPSTETKLISGILYKAKMHYGKGIVGLIIIAALINGYIIYNENNAAKEYREEWKETKENLDSLTVVLNTTEIDLSITSDSLKAVTTELIMAFKRIDSLQRENNDLLLKISSMTNQVQQDVNKYEFKSLNSKYIDQIQANISGPFEFLRNAIDTIEIWYSEGNINTFKFYQQFRSIVKDNKIASVNIHSQNSVGKKSSNPIVIWSKNSKIIDEFIKCVFEPILIDHPNIDHLPFHSPGIIKIEINGPFIFDDEGRINF